MVTGILSVWGAGTRFITIPTKRMKRLGMIFERGLRK
jgi:hypothetical protein